jgi:GH35 family endo-1,4-beta-xylanase
MATALAPGMLAISLPPGKSILPAEDFSLFSLEGSQKALAKTQIVDVPDQSFKKALRITTAPGASAEWSVQLRAASLAAPVKANDVLIGHFWMRCVESMTGDGAVGFVIEQNHEPFDKAVERRINVGSKWTECFIPFRAQRDLPADQTQICFRLGFDRQTIELGGIEVLNFGRSVKLEDLPRTKITYIGRDANAAWRKQALDRIEKIRKGDMKILVTDAGGKPVANATVRAKLIRHEFGFGSCVTAELLTAQTPDAQRYRDFIETNFNRAVFENDLKWPAVYDGVPPRVDQALDWLLQHRIAVRGHNLVWPSWQWSPKQLKQYDNRAELGRITAAHITDVVSHFRGKLIQWDVVNEPFSNHELTDALGGRSVIIDWFKLAHQADPNCKLFLNDYGIVEGGRGNAHRESFFETIKYLKDNGAPIHGIGIQSHFASDLPALDQIVKVLDRFSELGLPIESTELSLNVDDQQLQADYMRDYMIAVFSHPKVDGIMLWGFWEKRHWRPRAALLSADWSVRPVGQAWLDLVHKQWATQIETRSDDRGIAQFRGFFGDYELTISTGEKTRTVKAHLGRGATNETTKVVLD